MTGVAGRAQDIALSNLTTGADLTETKAEILEWMISTIGLQTLVILGAVMALAKVTAH